MRRLTNFGIIATLNKITVDTSPTNSSIDFVTEIAVSNVKPLNTGFGDRSAMGSSIQVLQIQKENRNNWKQNTSLCFSTTRSETSMQKPSQKTAYSKPPF